MGLGFRSSSIKVAIRGFGFRVSYIKVTTIRVLRFRGYYIKEIITGLGV